MFHASRSATSESPRDEWSSLFCRAHDTSGSSELRPPLGNAPMPSFAFVRRYSVTRRQQRLRTTQMRGARDVAKSCEELQQLEVPV